MFLITSNGFTTHEENEEPNIDERKKQA